MTITIGRHRKPYVGAPLVPVEGERFLFTTTFANGETVYVTKVEDDMLCRDCSYGDDDTYVTTIGTMVVWCDIDTRELDYDGDGSEAFCPDCHGESLYRDAAELDEVLAEEAADRRYQEWKDEGRRRDYDD